MSTTRNGVAVGTKLVALAAAMGMSLFALTVDGELVPGVAALDQKTTVVQVETGVSAEAWSRSPRPHPRSTQAIWSSSARVRQQPRTRPGDGHAARWHPDGPG